MTLRKVYLVASGMLTPVGYDSVSTAAAVRAGVSAYANSAHYNKNRQAMRMALIPDDALPPLNPALESNSGLTARQRRLLRIATPALQNLVSTLPLKEPPALFLALPEVLPGLPAAAPAKFFDHLILQTEVPIDKSVSRIFSRGRAGGVEIIDLAFNYLQSSGNDVVVVGGIDTYLDHVLLGSLDREDRILAENSSDGFAPGEAAGFLMLVSENVAQSFPEKIKAQLFMPGLASEQGHRYSEHPYRGDGLSAAFQKAIAQADGTPIHTIYSSLNGESFGVKEYGVALIRNKAAFTENVVVEHPADCFGDIGAAFAPVMIGMLAEHGKGSFLVYCSSDCAPRGSVVVKV